MIFHSSHIKKDHKWLMQLHYIQLQQQVKKLLQIVYGMFYYKTQHGNILLYLHHQQILLNIIFNKNLLMIIL